MLVMLFDVFVGGHCRFSCVFQKIMHFFLTVSLSKYV